jgi:uncharacterized protein (TIGR03435 family)
MIRLTLPTFLAATLLAQSGAPRFDVAAIKPSSEAMLNYMFVRAQPGGRLTATAPVKLLIQNAYSLQPFQIVGGPSWVESDRYEIDAKAEGNPPREQLLAMLQPLLAERFHLQTHRETRELPVYALVVSKGGSKLPSPQDGSCTKQDPNSAPILPPPGTPPPCGRIVVRASPAGVRMLGGQVPLSEFIRVLSTVMGRTVLDRTGLTATYDISVGFTPDSLAAGLPPLNIPSAGASDSAPPSIVTAIQEQLGLKLESTKGPVNVLVIDRVERPTAN